MLGLGKGEVKLVPYDEDWANLYEKEKSLLQTIIGEHVLGIEHIGSTAIKGIHAKPVIDIVIGVNTLEDIEQFDKKRLIIEADYYHLPKVKVDGKVVFAKFSDLDNLIRTHYLHVVEYEGDWWKEYLQFRDRLNDSLELRKEYESLKLEAAGQFGDNVEAYTNLKETFVKKVLS